MQKFQTAKIDVIKPINDILPSSTFEVYPTVQRITNGYIEFDFKETTKKLKNFDGTDNEDLKEYWIFKRQTHKDDKRIPAIKADELKYVVKKETINNKFVVPSSNNFDDGEFDYYVLASDISRSTLNDQTLSNYLNEEYFQALVQNKVIEYNFI
jgi:hypothetical protein